jgi:hypothetical protein
VAITTIHSTTSVHLPQDTLANPGIVVLLVTAGRPNERARMADIPSPALLAMSPINVDSNVPAGNT